MGAFTTWPSWPASGSAGGGVAAAAGAGRASTGAGAAARPGVAAGAGVMLTAPPLTIFTFSSPSVISSSAMPDSCTRSISFFSLRRSIASSPRGGDSAPRTCGGLQCVVESKVIPAAAQAADGSDRQVGKVRAVPESLARVDIGEVNLDERDGDPGKRIAQRNARMRVGSRVEDDEADAVAARLLNPVDQFGFEIALVANHLRARGASGLDESAIGGLQALPALDR